MVLTQFGDFENQNHKTSDFENQNHDQLWIFEIKIDSKSSDFKNHLKII